MLIFPYINSVVIMIALSVACTTSVMLKGFFVKYQWFKNGPNLLTYQVGGVIIDKPNEYTEDITKKGYTEVGYGTLECLLLDFNHLKYMPANYSRFFPSIKFLLVRRAHVKYVTNSDFIELKSINHIDFGGNEVEHLPGNLFEGVKTLRTVSFGENKITNIGLNFMANIKGVTNLVLGSNPCINLTTPVITNTFIIAIKTSCQLPIIPDVSQVPQPTYEDYKALNKTTVNLINKNKNLTTKLKLCQDKGKLPLRKQKVLTTLK